GTGLLKPNVSAMVGELYPEGGARRDAGFSIFYMGINLGAFIGPLVCGALGESEKWGWHYGFGAAGVGMVLGLVQYQFSRPLLGEAGLRPGHAGGMSRRQLSLVGVLVGLLAMAVLLGIAGVIRYDAVKLARGTTAVLVGVAIVYFGSAFFFAARDSTERKRIGAILILCVAAALFWAGFEQAGSSFNLFSERYTRRDFFGGIPACWFQALGPLFLITLAPVLAGLLALLYH